MYFNQVTHSSCLGRYGCVSVLHTYVIVFESIHRVGLCLCSGGLLNLPYLFHIGREGVLGG